MWRNWMQDWQEGQEEEPKSEDRQTRPGCMRLLSLFIWIPILVAIVLWMWGRFGGDLAGTPTEINYSAFRQQLKDGNVERVTVIGTRIQGEFVEPLEVEDNQGEEYANFVTHLPSFGDDELLSLLEEQNVEITARPVPKFSWVSILLSALPILLLLGVAFFLFNRMQSQAGQSLFSMGQSRARLYDRRQERTTFDDVAGAQGAKAELEEIIEFLKDPHRFERLGGEMPTGVLLVGPPGTGKTLLARAVAGEAGVPFFSITGSDFMEMFVGVGASRVRSLFGEAKKVAPSIVFIDELDSIGRRRGAGLGGGHDEREQTLNQLLSELDGFDPNESVIVMAATNRPDILDPALLRPGRFDRQVTVDKPTASDRLKILEIHARGKPMSGEIDLGELARGTPGFSGADLENLLNEAALLAARKGKDSIEREDIEDARDKMLLGLERESLGLTDDELRLLAYHEAGHAVVAAVAPHADPIHKVTIVPRGRAMGVTQQLPERDKYVYSREYMLDRLAVMMGGRAAEELILGTATSGAENDLKQATQLARKMVLDWGMSERLGHVALGGRSEHVFLGEEIAQRREYSETTAYEVDEEIKAILEVSYVRALNTLREHRDGLDRLADALLEHEEIPGKEVLELIGANGVDKGSRDIILNGQ
jgi:cell division protease FtsH